MKSSDNVELLLKISRRAFVLLLIAFLWLGSTCLAIAFFPETILARWPMRAPWVFPVALTVSWAGLRATLRRGRWNPRPAEVEIVMHDEFRQSNLLRAQRAAFIAMLVLQIPLALTLMNVSTTRALVGMAGVTINCGGAVLAAAFLFLDRE